MKYYYINNIFILIILGIIALSKSVGLDPDSAHYNEWIINGTYKNISVEPLFILVADFCIYAVGSENAYYFLNFFFIFSILLCFWKILVISDIKYYLIWFFFCFCYISIVLTQIRFGLALILFIYSILLFWHHRYISALIFLTIAFISHFSILILFLLYVANILLNFIKYPLINTFGLIFSFFLAVLIYYFYINSLDFIIYLDFGEFQNKILDNFLNTQDKFSYLKSSNIFIGISLFYIYLKFRKINDYYKFNFLYIVGIVAFSFSMNPVLHIRIFQFYVLLFPLFIKEIFRLNISRNRFEFIIFYLYPFLYLFNDIFRNNFFGIK